MIHHSALNDFTTQNLFLLIGTNPLPNFVAARLLLKPKGNLFLVHSDNTLPEATRLSTLLKQEIENCQIAMVRIDESDASNIYGDVKKAVQFAGSDSIGLHYTGGTKVMAVHTHRAVRDALAEQGKPPAILSYLDARTYQMRFDPIGVSNVPGQKVLLDVNLSLEDLLKLHDITLVKNRSLVRDTQLPESAKLLAQILSDEITAKSWRNWCNAILRRNAREMKKEKEDWIKEDNLLETIELLWPSDHLLKPVGQQICDELGIRFVSTIRLGDVKNKPFSKIYHFCRWLDGIWLEQYVYNQVENLRTKCEINDVAMSLDTVNIPTKPNFEVDLGVIRGYQLFGISCTTSLEKDRMKSRLFEAYLRTSQLGGDEARTALICPHPHPESLEKEIRLHVPDKVRVFGAKHLIDLQKELEIWFTESDYV
jgi:hypothetical protein